MSFPTLCYVVLRYLFSVADVAPSLRMTSLNLGRLADFDLALSGLVLVFVRRRLQVDLPLPVEHDLCDLPVQLVTRLPQTFV